MFIPLRDENPTSRKPIVTIIIIAINCLIYLYGLTKPTAALQRFIVQYALIPSELTHFVELTPYSSVPILLTPLTSMFLHGGFMHLAGNMLFLWVFGNNIEDYLGPIKFILFYLLSGFAADFLFVLFSPNSQIPLIGASGAISGTLGAYLVLYPRARILTLIFLFYFIRIVRMPAMVVLGFWIVYQIIMSAIDSGSGGGVAWLAHVGGFAFGWILFKIISFWRRDKRQKIYRVEWH
jgi:membrane associated rhomboid family serine protease